MADIAIITVSKNSEETISSCIESVAIQNSDCKHLLVDGASVDRTVDIASSYGTHFTHVLSEQDEGMYQAMNKGIALANSEIIGILNADDFYVSDNVLASVAEAFIEPYVAACYGDLEYVSAQDTSRVLRRWRSGDFSLGKFYNGWMPPHPTLFVRRQVYEQFGMYREDMGTSADYEFMLRIFLKNGIKAQYIPKVLVRMRVGGASNYTMAARWRANRNDARAWRVNGLQPKAWTTIAKPLRKILQWWV